MKTEVNLNNSPSRIQDENLSLRKKIGILEAENAELRCSLSETRDLLSISGSIGYWDWNAETGYADISETLMNDWGIDPSSYKHSLEESLARIHRDDRDRIWDEIQKATFQNLPYDVEYRVVRPSGEIIWINAKGRAYCNKLGKPYRLTGITINVTEKKRAAENLKEAKDEAERANKVKSAFLANMSHEIRTPLGAIIGFTDLLKDSNVTNVERVRFIDTISRNGKALTRIIDDILDLSKVEAGRLEIECVEFSFVVLLDEVIDLFREQMREKQLYLILNINNKVPKLICSDPVRLRQVLVNIIGNAIKFTSKGGVTISVSSSSDEDWHNFTIDVVDTGIGLTHDQREKLFEPFAQAETSTNRRFGGTGLGLALSRRLARALGGDIQIRENIKKSGSTFSITFKARGPKSNKSPFKIAMPQDFIPDLCGVNILLAEDCPDNQYIIKKILEKTGANVEVVSNGVQVLERTNEKNFDIVLMDIQMPLMDGYEATRILRGSGYSKPIVALTAHAMAEERELTHSVGCNGHLTKPINSTELFSTLSDHVKGCQNPFPADP
ncbi:MAG: response regulator [Bdellovibrionales bacterium]|nr:response regulator [Bdellovibrionales bacterium]